MKKKCLTKSFLLSALIGAIALTGCYSNGGGGKFCKPENIRSGRSSQHHDSKKMRAGKIPPNSIRVMWVHRDGPVIKVRYQNMKTTQPRVYYGNLPSDLIIEGQWVPVDSLCLWDARNDSVTKK